MKFNYKVMGSYLLLVYFGMIILFWVEVGLVVVL